MEKLLIGSAGIKHWFPDFPRDCKDYDYLTREENSTEFVDGVMIEKHNIPYLLDLTDEEIALEPDLIYTLKVSHIFWDIKWEKHIFDIVFLKAKGCKLNKDLFYKLYNFWENKHGVPKRSDLEMSKEDFFNNCMPKNLPSHDYIHTLIVEIPTYKKVLKDGADVEVDENKFNQLTHEEKLELVREEVYVMAWERLNGRDYRIGYTWMLKKFILSHAPFYEALFIIENYYELRKPLFNYKKKIDYELSRN